MPDDIPWYEADLVAVDLEGTGAQDRENEAILEIAFVPIVAGEPRVDQAYETLLNPGRHVPQRPWISPGLTDETLGSAPRLADVATEITSRIDGRYLVGHNVTVDWRLLHRDLPDASPAGLIDTLRLARHLRPDLKGRSLTNLLEQLDLTGEIKRQVPAGRPHRALWDTTAAAHLLRVLLAPSPPGLPELLKESSPDRPSAGEAPPTLWG
jgi:DNA polymerase III epsilon subunit-like protein